MLSTWLALHGFSTEMGLLLHGFTTDEISVTIEMQQEVLLNCIASYIITFNLNTCYKLKKKHKKMSPFFIGIKIRL